jgi:hypothetical protein
LKLRLKIFIDEAKKTKREYVIIKIEDYCKPVMFSLIFLLLVISEFLSLIIINKKVWKPNYLFTLGFVLTPIVV